MFKVDATKTGAPISKFIYGQFVEHLGRSIYGGLWAEMIEDRKFFYPITDNYAPWGTGTDEYWKSGEFHFLNASPWKVIEPAGTVSMDETHAYTGSQAPLIHLAGDGTAAGISQPDLALVAGKKYTGHIVLAGDASAAPILVQLVLSDGAVLTQSIGQVSSTYESHVIEFTAPRSDNSTTIQIISKGKGTFRIGAISLMPSDNVNGWRRDTVSRLKELNSPVYRWPGGNFVSGYNWKDGVGVRDTRPPRKNPAWKSAESNDVGIHEFMQLMQMIGAEPYVAVNTGLGTVAQAAEEVEYFRGSVQTPMGRMRAQNGHPLPFSARFWAVGNEMYGKWQLGYMPLADYVKKHNATAEAIWKVDPSALLVGSGEVGEWTETMLKVCGTHMNYLSEHFYCKEQPDVAQHAGQLAAEVKRIATAHRRYRTEITELAGKPMGVALDEWNYWYGTYVYGELGVRYRLKDGLGVAKGLHEFFRNSDIFFMANYAQTVNVLGSIKTSRTNAELEATGLALALYRNHFGVIPIEINDAPANLDVSVAWTADKRAITIAIVNVSNKSARISADFGQLKFKPVTTRWLLGGTDPEAYNEPDLPAKIKIETASVAFRKGVLDVPPLSVAMYRLELR